jgi:radical SAM superfamily enzyme YgiQ (UPF0313 family)
MKTLLVYPNQSGIYKGTPLARVSHWTTMPLNLLTAAGWMIKQGESVSIVDLNFGDGDDKLDRALRTFRPDRVGFTAYTASIYEAERLAQRVKFFDTGIHTMIGGAHAMAAPDDVRPYFDEVWAGEYEQGVKNLDDLPFLPVELLGNPNDYRVSRFLCRKSPVALMETSRGCFGKCVFCANYQRRKMRFKSVQRVVDEMVRLHRAGYNEIRFVDYIFSADMERSKRICEEIIHRGLKVPWYPHSGIRVDRVDLELLQLMQRAGCYRVGLGIESGSQRVLDAVQKGISLEQTRNAVKLLKQAGIEIEGFFMMGMPGETERDLADTVKFMRELDLDYTRFAFPIPYPGTQMTDRMKSQGQIKSYDWEQYRDFSNCRQIYDHDTLDWDTLEHYRKLFMYTFNHRPGSLFRRAKKMLVTGKWKGYLDKFSN